MKTLLLAAGGLLISSLAWAQAPQGGYIRPLPSGRGYVFQPNGPGAAPPTYFYQTPNGGYTVQPGIGFGHPLQPPTHIYPLPAQPGWAVVPPQRNDGGLPPGSDMPLPPMIMGLP